MSRSETPTGARLDLDGLGQGPSETAPCGICETPTRSHTLVDTGDEWAEFAGEETLADVDAGTIVTFAVVCHGCFETLALPAHGDGRDSLTAALEGDGVFRGVVG